MKEVTPHSSNMPLVLHEVFDQINNPKPVTSWRTACIQQAANQLLALSEQLQLEREPKDDGKVVIIKTE